MPKLRNYQADRFDRVFLWKLNEKRMAVGLPSISEKTFGQVIDKLEVSCCQVLFYYIACIGRKSKILQPLGNDFYEVLRIQNFSSHVD